MRITSSMYYNNLYSKNNTKLNQNLFDVNKQISSGLKIQYAYDDVSVFTETMVLDNEVTTLNQVSKSTENGYKMANQTDVVLNDFEDTIKRFRTLLVQAGNDTNDDASLDAIAAELEGIKKHFITLSNTSINGQYLFSGSKLDVKPIDENGIYRGDSKEIHAFLGSNVTQPYNLTGAELFLGEDKSVKKEVSTNVVNKNLIDENEPIHTIRDLMGDIDDDENTVNKNYFYVRGTRHDGTAFKEKIELDDTADVTVLLDKIGDAYGNDGDRKVVDVRLNSSNEIVIEDRRSGSSKLDFHMVGAVDFDTSDGDDANVTDLDDLDDGESDYQKIKDGTSSAANDKLFVHEFVKSGLLPADGAATNIEGIVYDRTQFSVKGANVSSNMAQVKKDTNEFASHSIKLSEVADLKQGNNGTLDGTQFKLSGVDIDGNTYDVQIDFKNSANGGSTFSPDGGTTNYKIFDMGDPREAVNADDMTYKQLMDVMNMVVTNNYPATENNADDYDDAIIKSNLSANTHLTYDGKIEFTQKGVATTKATVAMYDSNSDDISKPASVMTFNTNDALSTRDPKTDFFKTIDEAIQAVQDYKSYPDASEGHVRSVGIENALGHIDDLSEHIYKAHSKIGAYSNALSTSLERTQTLTVNTMSLRSSVVDTDMAEAALSLQQLNNNYEALLSTVGKVSKLSLVNYL